MKAVIIILSALFLYFGYHFFDFYVDSSFAFFATWLFAILIALAFLADYLDDKRRAKCADFYVVFPKKRTVSAETRKKISVKALAREKAKREAKK